MPQGSMGNCIKVYQDDVLGSVSPPTDICPQSPASFLLSRVGGAWTVDPVWDLPPSPRGKDAAWGSVDEGLLYFVSEGAGTWKGTMSW